MNGEFGLAREHNQFQPISFKKKKVGTEVIEFENEKITTSLSTFYHLSKGKFQQKFV